MTALGALGPVAGVFAALLVGCEAAQGPCAADYLGCDDGEGTFRLDPNCTLTGPLNVQIGQGDAAFTPLPEGVFPTLHHGPQGGEHMFLAVRVEGPEAETVTSIEATFEVRRLEPEGVCTPPLRGFSPVDVPGHGPICSYVGKDRSVVLGVRSPLRRDGSAIEEFGLVLVGGYQPNAWWVGVTVRDQCGRTGTDAVWHMPPNR